MSTVSVIIPNFNHAHYLGEAIQSVLAQTHRDLEIVVVDDGSTDETRDVLSHFGDPVRVVWQRNQGLSAARNTGIRNARGNYICVLDADDMYEPKFMSTMVSLLEADPGAAAAYCGYRFVDDLNQPLPQQEARQVPSDRFFEALADGNFLVPESMMVRASCYAAVGPFDETLTSVEDWDMWLRISRRHKVVGTRQVLTRHRVLPVSMSTNADRMLRNRLVVVEKHFGAAGAPSVPGASSATRPLGQAYLVSAIEYLQSHSEERAFECVKAMALACPALLSEEDTFVRLAYGDQPKGYMGDSRHLDIEGSAATLSRLLARLSADSGIVSKGGITRRALVASSYGALGKLSYEAKQYGRSRRFLLKAMVSWPGMARYRRLLSLFVKSLLGPAIVDRLKVVRASLGQQPTGVPAAAE